MNVVQLERLISCSLGALVKGTCMSFGVICHSDVMLCHFALRNEDPKIGVS
jgi:hypothetical protein